MKQTFYYILVAILLFQVSCSEDFNTAAEFKDIPVVMGLLSISDTAHYIRVERAFLAPNENAYEVAKIPDSVYYKNLDVKIEDLVTGRLYTLREVDGNLEGHIRQDGPFPTSPNILYKISASELELEGGREYRLLINRGDNLPLITANTFVLNNIRLFNPLEGASIRFTELATVRINYEKLPATFFFDVEMEITVREINSVEGINVLKKLTWPLARRTTADRVTIRGDEFMGFLAGAGFEKGNAFSRRIENIDIIISAGGREFFEFANVILANSGITATQEVPVYTNIQGGRGLFSSRNKQIFRNYRITAETVQALKENNLTRDLNFF
jgi:hypothetical protein